MLRRRNVRPMQPIAAQVRGQAMERVTTSDLMDDLYVRDISWQAVGVAAAVELLLGLLLSRR